MEKTSAWAALYFIALMTFGNYVLFNLLVAILVEGFSTEVKPTSSIVLMSFGEYFRKAVALPKVVAVQID
jgi:hypothetical protein